MLAGVDAAGLARIAERVVEVAFEPGHVIARQGDVGTGFFIIASGNNQRQVQAVCDDISERLKKETNSRPVRIEGYSSAEWVLMDYGDFIVHVFDKDARDFYDLERLWRDARRVEVPAGI